MTEKSRQRKCLPLRQRFVVDAAVVVVVPLSRRERELDENLYCQPLCYTRIFLVVSLLVSLYTGTLVRMGTLWLSKQRFAGE